MASTAGLFRRFQHVHIRARGLVFTLWVRVFGGHAGRRICVDKRVRLRHIPTRRWWIDDDVYLGYGAIIDVWPGAELRIGARAKIMHYVVIGAAESIVIGADTQVAELSSVRDFDHGMDTLEPMITAGVISEPVRIGDDVWVARGCAVLRGSDIRDGAVVGANSVVRGIVPERTIVAGAPARVIRQRRSDAAGPTPLHEQPDGPDTVAL